MKMLTKTKIYVCIVGLLILNTFTAFAAELSLKGLEEGIRQGDVALVKVESDLAIDSISGQFDGRELVFQGDGPTQTALIGAAMNMEPGDYQLVLTALADGQDVSESYTVAVRARDYKVERLSLPKKMVTPAAKEVIARIIREANSLKKVKKMLTPERFWDGEFVHPADGLFADNFGVRRIINGIEKKPHSGNDLKAYAGTPVKSPNGGTVVYVDKMYYGGKTVVVDHGHGLSTLYMHLSKILVNHGERVEKGEVIGLVGSTGRSTGPHLHWGAYLGGINVDPASLLSLSFDVMLPAEGLADAGEQGGTLGGN
jgi:biotin carboxyl carrier protein